MSKISWIFEPMVSVQVFIYAVIIGIAKFLLPVFSLFVPKIKAFLTKRKNHNQFPVCPEGPIVWFHCSSMGEFEQGRPVISNFREQNPTFSVLVSFFSPSGFENRKDDPLVDTAIFLPLDGTSEINQLLDHFDPKIVFFVKYEFWYHTLRAIHNRNIPLILFATIFRPEQLFFKWYGGLFKAMLSFFDHIFVQNHSSKKLLEGINIPNVSVSGDTRFERVAEIKQQAKLLPAIKAFKSESDMWVCGSTWPEDHKSLLPLIKNHPEIKFIIVPHEVDEIEIDNLNTQLLGKAARYSAGNFESKQVLIIDRIGMLSHIYQYANFAYIGGGFGKGLHNTLEAAAYGIPIFFGNTNYKKFAEAVTLKQEEIAYVIHDAKSLELSFKKIDSHDLREIKKKSNQFMSMNQGASHQIVVKASQLIELNAR